MFVVPENVEVESMRHIVVYDSDTSSLKDLGKSSLISKKNAYNE